MILDMLPRIGTPTTRVEGHIATLMELCLDTDFRMQYQLCYLVRENQHHLSTL